MADILKYSFMCILGFLSSLEKDDYFELGSTCEGPELGGVKFQIKFAIFQHDRKQLQVSLSCSNLVPRAFFWRFMYM